MARLLLNKKTLLLLLVGHFVTIQAVSAAPLDRLAGVWESLDSMTTMGQCISAPVEEISPYCAAFALADLREGSLRGDGFLSATESTRGKRSDKKIGNCG